MSELDGIIRTAAEAHDIELSSLSGSAGPIGQTPCHLSLQTGASLSPSFFFLSVFAHSACERISPGSDRRAVVRTVRVAWRVSEVPSRWSSHRCYV